MRFDPRDILAAFLFSFLLLTCHGCKSSETVITHSDSTYVHTGWLDSLIHSTNQKDSVYIRDSIYIYKSGDTVTVEKYQWRDRWRTRYDTITWKIETHDVKYVEKRDTLWQRVDVERELTTWQKARMRIGEIAIGLIIVFVLLVMYKNGSND